MDDKYLSIDREPALGGGRFEGDPAERRAAPTGRPPDETEALRDSVAAEPALPQHDDPGQWTRWLRQKRSKCTLPGNLAVTALVVVLGGPLAIVGAVMAGRPHTTFGIIYVIVFGPVVEELAKQGGMTYLLEKKPYRVFAAWQFVLAAAFPYFALAMVVHGTYNLGATFADF